MTPLDVRRSFEALDTDKRARCLALLCESGRAHLTRYFGDRTIEYRDSVVGLHHVMDADLPFRALSAIRSAKGIPPASVLDSLIADYQEPITAHQDADFKISDAHAEYAYLAVYNLVRSCQDPGDNERAWLVVRQAASANLPLDPTQGDVDEFLARWVEQWATA